MRLKHYKHKVLSLNHNLSIRISLHYNSREYRNLPYRLDSGYQYLKDSPTQIHSCSVNNLNHLNKQLHNKRFRPKHKLLLLN